jgi:hypothetical protein
MTRLEATRAIAVAGDAAIIASLGHPAHDLCRRRPSRNFYTWGSMGSSSIGPDSPSRAPTFACSPRRRRSLLMNLGSLATIGCCIPANLVVM